MSGRVFPNDGDERLLTVQELAKALRVPQSWVYERTRPGSVERLPCYRLGKYIRFKLSEVLAYLRERSNAGR